MHQSIRARTRRLSPRQRHRYNFLYDKCASDFDREPALNHLGCINARDIERAKVHVKIMAWGAYELGPLDCALRCVTLQMANDVIALHSKPVQEYRCVCIANLGNLQVTSDTRQCSRDSAQQLQMYQFCPSNFSLELHDAPVDKNYDVISTTQADDEWNDILRNFHF